MEDLNNGDKVLFNGKEYVYGEGEFVGDTTEDMATIMDAEIGYAGLWTPLDWECEEPPCFCIVEKAEDFEPFDDGSWGYVLRKHIEKLS